MYEQVIDSNDSPQKNSLKNMTARKNTIKSRSLSTDLAKEAPPLVESLLQQVSVYVTSFIFAATSNTDPSPTS